MLRYSGERVHLLNGGRRRTCLLTGASGYLGRVLAEHLSRTHEVVAVGYRNGLDVASQESWVVDPFEFEEQVESAEPVYSVRMDLTASHAVQHLVDIAVARLGTVDLVVNAAATCERASVFDAARMSQTALSQLKLNTIVPVELAIALMRRCWIGREFENRAIGRNIVNVSSTSAIDLVVGDGQAMYSASKAALEVASLHLAEELRPIGIRVNVVAPDRMPTKCSPDEVISTIMKLDGDVSTGEVITVRQDGPTTLKPRRIVNSRPTRERMVTAEG